MGGPAGNVFLSHVCYATAHDHKSVARSLVVSPRQDALDLHKPEPSIYDQRPALLGLAHSLIRKQTDGHKQDAPRPKNDHSPHAQLLLAKEGNPNQHPA